MELTQYFNSDNEPVGYTAMFSSALSEEDAMQQATDWKENNVTDGKITIEGVEYEVCESVDILIVGGLWIIIYLLLFAL